MKKAYKGTIFVLIASLGLSTEAIFAKLCFDSGVNVMTVISLRYAISTVLLAGFVLAIKDKFKMEAKSIKLLFVNVAIFITFTVFLFKSYDLLPAGLAIMLLYTFVAFTGILEAVINKVKLTKNKIITIGLSLAGIAALSGASFSSVSSLGIVLGIAAAIGYALYFIYMEKALDTGVSEPTFMVNLFFFATIAFSAYGLATGGISLAFPPMAWVYLGLLSVFSTSIALLALTYGIPLLGPTRSAIISTFEPPMTALWAFIIFKEIFTPLQAVGAALVISSILWNALSAGKEAGETDKETSIETKEGVK